MNAKAEQESSLLDTIKLLVALAMVLGAAVAFSLYKDESLLLRVVGILGVIALAIAVMMTTIKGKIAWSFLKDARVEIRKVVWPTRQETLQTTLIVCIMVVIVGLILWTMDQIILYILSLLVPAK